LECLEQALAWGARQQADRLAGQASIFDLGEPSETKSRNHPSVPVREVDKNELLRMEKETLGVYVSEHPLHAVRDQLRLKTDCGLRVRGGRGAEGRDVEDRRARGAGWRGARAGGAGARFPGGFARAPAAADDGGDEGARPRAAVQGQAGAGLLRRGEGAARGS